MGIMQRALLTATHPLHILPTLDATFVMELGDRSYFYYNTVVDSPDGLQYFYPNIGSYSQGESQCIESVDAILPSSPQQAVVRFMNEMCGEHFLNSALYILCAFKMLYPILAHLICSNSTQFLGKEQCAHIALLTYSILQIRCLWVSGYDTLAFSIATSALSAEYNLRAKIYISCTVYVGKVNIKILFIY